MIHNLVTTIGLQFEQIIKTMKSILEYYLIIITPNHINKYSDSHSDLISMKRVFAYAPHSGDLYKLVCS
jgi:hypothetical protein